MTTKTAQIENTETTWKVSFTSAEMDQFASMCRGAAIGHGFAGELSDPINSMLTVAYDSLVTSLIGGGQNEIFYSDGFNLCAFISGEFDTWAKQARENDEYMTRAEAAVIAEFQAWVDAKRADRVEVPAPF